MIYSDPIISQIATTYPVNKSLITIPKVKVRGTVQNTDGTKTSWVLPRDTYLVRGASLNLSLTPNISNNLYALASVDAEDANVNKRYFIVTGVNLHVTLGTTDTNIVAPISVRPDARGQLATKFTFIDPNVTLTTPGGGHPSIEGSLIGNIDFNSGSVQYSISYTSPATGMPANFNGYTTDSISSTIVFSPRKTDIGRVKVSLDIQGWDVNIDVKDDFEVELQTESIDDYKDIYNIDLIRTLSLAIN
jgi:hypothetical protein